MPSDHKKQRQATIQQQPILDQGWLTGQNPTHKAFPTLSKFVGLWTAATVTSINTHTHLTTLCAGLPGSAGTKKVKPIWILLKQETVSDSGIRWAICKSAPRSR